MEITQWAMLKPTNSKFMIGRGCSGPYRTVAMNTAHSEIGLEIEFSNLFQLILFVISPEIALSWMLYVMF
jgi:hypothetical protein